MSRRRSHVTMSLATVLLAPVLFAQGAPAAATDPSTAVSTGASSASTPVSQPSRALQPPPVVTDTIPLPGSNIPAGRAVAEFAAPLDAVAAVMTDFARYNQFMPQVRDSRVIHRRRGQVDLYMRVELLRNLGTLWMLSHFTVRRSARQVVVEGQMTQGNLSRFDVHLEADATAAPNRTRVTMVLRGIPSAFFPSALVAPQQPRWTTRALLAMQNRVEHGGR